MSIVYSDQGFLRLLFRWRGSVWRLVWRKLLIFLLIYYAINFVYRFALPGASKDQFERIVIFLSGWSRFIPITFLLGFYVAFVVRRWWEQLLLIQYPDKFLLFVAVNIKGQDDESRMIRRTFARYTTLIAVLMWREMSKKVKKRFPTLKHVQEAGLMTQQEYELYMQADAGYDGWSIPVAWIGNLMGRCIEEERVSDSTAQRMLDVLDSYRNSFRTLSLYDWISVPLVYTQVVTLATFGYFILCLIGRQLLEDRDPPRAGREVDMKFPFFTTLEFLFYVGWLKVAEELNFPFGEDDEDFAMNYFVDRYFRMSYMIVDDLTKHEVILVRDRHWDERHPSLPHTIASSSIEVCDQPPRWRLENYKINENEYNWVTQNLKSNANNFSKETKALLADLNDV